MYNLKQIGRVIFSAVVAVTFSTSAAVADNTTDSDAATASAKVVRALTIEEDDTLRFGKFIAPGTDDGSGTVTIDPNYYFNGADLRTKSGDIILLDDDVVDYGVASFDILGEPNESYYVDIEDTAEIYMDASNKMEVSLFVSDPEEGSSTSTALSDKGRSQVYVGATLTAEPGQAGGEYEGTYDVTVTYK